MPRHLYLLIALLGLAHPAYAISESEIIDLQTQWAKLQYDTHDDAAQEQGFAALVERASTLAAKNPTAAEPLIWKGIALASQAQQHGDMNGLRLAEQGRDALLAALKIDPQAMKGAAYITLGALYYKVPGWPIGFGDLDKAREFLRRAIAANPDSVDAHYFYGELLYQQKQYAQAAEELRKSIDAPKQPGSSTADEGRRADARQILAKVKRKR